MWSMCRSKKRLVTLIVYGVVGCMIFNFLFVQWHRPKSPISVFDDSHNRKETFSHKTLSPLVKLQNPGDLHSTNITASQYIELLEHDIPGGDVSCDDIKDCISTEVDVSKAKDLCSNDPKCKGFVKAFSTTVFFKNDLTKRIIPKSGVNLYVKSEHAQSIKMPLSAECVVPLIEIRSDTSNKCNIAEFDPFDPEIVKLIDKPELPLRCDGLKLSQYRNGVLSFTNKDAKVAKAEVIAITRTPGNDNSYEEASAKTVDHHDTTKLNHEFIRVQTTTEDQRQHIEYHAAVAPKPDVVARPKPTTGIPVNVMIVGIDSMSNAHFQRTLSDAYKYLKDELKSIILRGYAIVGDGTTPALTAMLTGHFEKELPEARRGFAGAQPVDDWPWIYKDFKKSGYATLFSEDGPGFGSFNYRLYGFKEPPTDHFSRYFWLATKYSKAFCMHSKPQHQIHLDYVESFFEAYPKTPKFGLAFLSDVSHNSMGNVYVLGDGMLTFVKNMEKMLNDTILIVLGDHGFRFGEARATLQGQLEERLPFISITLPSWFKTKYPNIVSNLRHNVNSVTSPFDLHVTLSHIRTYPDVAKPAVKGRGMSLFEKIPASRDCESAGVMEHYCPCLSLKPADRQHQHIQHGAQALVKHINKLLSDDKFGVNLCYQLELKQILSSQQQMPNTKFRKFLGSADIHGRIAKFADSSHDKPLECNYDIQIQTTPGDALFEAPVRLRDGEFIVTGDISRINKYGDQPQCILDKNRDLRKYCMCKT